MLFTNNYGMKKPGSADIVNVDDLNANFDAIDQLLTPAADPAQAPSSNGPAKLVQWVSWITNRIKSITGKENWYDDPDTTLADIVSTAAANKVLKLDDNAKLPASITGDAHTLDGKHANQFAAVDHSHTGDYAPYDHTHTELYAPVSHNHDSSYAPISHTHTEYAPVNHTHPVPFSIKTGTIRDQMTIPRTAGYKNYSYMVSLASIDTYGSSFDIGLAQRGSYPNYYTVASDVTRLGYVCSVDQNTLVVTARALADNNAWIAGYANYIEIAWN
jgi:hypothetical protein